MANDVYNFGRLLVVGKHSTLGVRDVKRLTGSAVAAVLRSKRRGDPVSTLYLYLPIAFEWMQHGVPQNADDVHKARNTPPIKIYGLDENAISRQYAKARGGAFVAALQFDDAAFRKFFKTIDLINAILMVRSFGCPGYPVAQKIILRNVARLGISRKNLSLYNGQLHTLANVYAQETLDDARSRVEGYMANKW